MMGAVKDLLPEDYDGDGRDEGYIQTQNADDLAVDCFAQQMKQKMTYSREVKKRHGWNNPAVCSMEDLKRMLQEHVEKGDMVDVGNFAMMIWNRQHNQSVF